MSTRYPGGVITKTPVVPAGPYETGAAPGIWTLDQQLQAAKAGIWPTAGLQPNYIEDVFSTYLYTGNSSTQTITNGIDLAGEGGLVWVKNRTGADNHILTDSARGTAFFLRSNLTNAQDTNSPSLISALNSNGFSLGVGYTDVNASANNYASWTFREQPKFFDVVTYTGTGAVQNIAHNLGSVPGCIIVKKTNDSSSWITYHRGLNGGTNPSQYFVALNLTNAEAASSNPWNNTAPTSAVFTAGLTNSEIGITYVAYLFAHDAGGFGLTGTDNVISCGSFTTDGSGAATVNLGYEPQWILTRSTGVDNWRIYDNMRGFDLTDGLQLLPNSSAAEASSFKYTPSATGFSTVAANVVPSQAYIYIAIRRGPMKVPTDATKVFEPVTATTVNQVIGTLEASDMGWFKDRATVANWFVSDRLRGIESYYNPTLYTNATDAEVTPSSGDTVSSQYIGNGKIYFGGAGLTTNQPLGYSFRRAPGFFDEVCYTGTGTTLNPTHNLGVVPELKIIKNRTLSIFWTVGGSVVTGGTQNDYIVLNSDAAKVANSTYWNSGSDTSTTFSTRTGNAASNDTGYTFVAYLFATVAGVSKVGTYTGTGTTQTINCGFTAGARFVMIKRTDSTGDWYVWDSARGIVAGNDPYLLLNSTAAEVTGTDYVDTAASGFEISSTAPAAINANGGSFIFLSIA